MKRAKLAVMDTPPEDAPTYTIEEYVALEEYSNVKHEWIDGVIRAMSGGTLEHSRLAAAVIAQLGGQLRGRSCIVFTSDARVHVVTGKLISYPDVSICCGDPETGTRDPLAMVNPSVLIEVTSPSTEKYDRGAKFTRYKRIPSLAEYVLVSQRDPLVEVFRRVDSGMWSDADKFGPGERAQLRSIGCEIDVDELYCKRVRGPSH